MTWLLCSTVVVRSCRVCSTVQKTYCRQCEPLLRNAGYQKRVDEIVESRKTIVGVTEEYS